MAETTQTDLQSLTADIVAAYVTKNKVSGEELSKLIGDTFQALQSAGSPPAGEPEAPKPDKAAIRKSISPDYLTSFIDGRRYKSLKRHLSSQDLTPGEYRKRFGLPNDYPMVASNYSAQRSQLAKTLGLGRRAATASEPAPAPADAEADASAPARKGRAKAAAKASA